MLLSCARAVTVDVAAGNCQEYEILMTNSARPCTVCGPRYLVNGRFLSERKIEFDQNYIVV